jgi:hypothetical protein
MNIYKCYIYYITKTINVNITYETESNTSINYETDE